ncbi:flavin reductase family protein [Streptomyces chiangmaiensis]
MSRFTTGVTIITTRTPDGPAGMTASAVASVSLDPLMLLVCVGNTLATRNAISESGVFAVSVLSRSQEQHALRFASRCEDKFAGLGLRTDHDLPVLEGAVAHFACNVKEEFAGETTRSSSARSSAAATPSTRTRSCTSAGNSAASAISVPTRSWRSNGSSLHRCSDDRWWRPGGHRVPSR